MEAVVGTLVALVGFFAALVALDRAAERAGVETHWPDVGRSLYQRYWEDAA